MPTQPLGAAEQEDHHAVDVEKVAVDAEKVAVDVDVEKDADVEKVVDVVAIKEKIQEVVLGASQLYKILRSHKRCKK